MNLPTIKSVSIQEIESAIAKKLASISGWEECSVTITSTEFDTPSFRTDEKFTMKMNVVLQPTPGPDPFSDLKPA